MPANRTSIENASENTVLEVPVNLIKVDPLYQRWDENGEPRQPSSRKVRRNIVDRFDPKLLDPITVARLREPGSRRVSLWAVDGATRLSAVRALQHRSIPARIVDVESREEAAKLFSLSNDNRTAVNGSSEHHAQLAQGDETAKAVESILNDYGFTAEPAGVETPYKRLSAVKAFYDAYAGRVGVLDRTIYLLGSVWGEKGYSTKLVNGMSEFLNAQWDYLDRYDLWDDFEKSLTDLGTDPARFVKGAGSDPSNKGGTIIANEFVKNFNQFTKASGYGRKMRFIVPTARNATKA